MSNKEYISTIEFAKVLGISRIAVYKKIKKGEIKAKKIGRNYAIPKAYLDRVQGKDLLEEDKAEIDKVVDKTIKDYGEVLKLLGRD
ncbi:MAG: excisionase family DNA-binding protein [bacterium]